MSWHRFWVFVMLMAVRGVQAVDVAGLYTVAVPVLDRSESARKAAEAEAFKAVLVKVSGQQSVLTQSGVLENLGKSSGYIQRYQIQQLTQPAITNGISTHLRLEVSFDGRAIERLLQAAAAPMWGNRRPLVLVWVALQDERGRRIIGSDDEPALAQELSDASQWRGVPILLPMYDLEEAEDVQITDVTGRFIEPLAAVSRKYNPEAMLVGRLEKNASGWSGQWSFAHGTLHKSISVEASERATVVKQTFMQIADLLAQKYAVVVDPNKESEVLLTVSNIQNIQQFGHVQTLLQRLQVVRQADAREVEANRVVFSVRLIADMVAFTQALSSEPRLQLDGDGLENALVYRWQDDALP